MKNKINKEQQKIAFFSLQKGLSFEEQRKKELFLWGNYCANGGDPTAIPGFYDFETEDGLVWSPTLEEFREAVMNKSRNPAERAKA